MPLWEHLFHSDFILFFAELLQRYLTYNAIDYRRFFVLEDNSLNILNRRQILKRFKLKLPQEFVSGSVENRSSYCLCPAYRCYQILGRKAVHNSVTSYSSDCLDLAVRYRLLISNDGQSLQC